MTRTVTVFEWWRPDDAKYNEPFQKREVGVGEFHQFGTDCTETEENIGTYSTAIVEMSDGSIVNVHVELIIFEDSNET